MSQNSSNTTSKPVRYAVVGTGGRVSTYIDALAKTHRADGQLVGICDTNPGRLAFYNNRLENELNHPRVPEFAADDFDLMIKQTRPDVVIVTTIDVFHDKYIIRAMELGCDVISEKPMTTDASKCRNILDAIQRTGQKVRVAFNFRWAPGPGVVRKMLQEKIIGQVIHADMEYLLNTSHGADYFRRWHREKDKSGGLLVHKATHHFDLVNWWLDAVPQTVFGFGQLAFYGRENAQKRGLEVNYDRYTGHDTQGDPFAFKLDSDKRVKALYMDNEKYDHYQRDRNVFGDNITAEDSMSVLVKYRNGVTLNYSLNAYLPREGFSMVFNGTQGRLEYTEYHTSHVFTGEGKSESIAETDWHYHLKVLPLFGKPYEVEVPTGKGDHGGADPLIMEQIFSANPPADLLSRTAGHGQGAASILIGIAANESFATGLPVNISDICPQLGDAVHLGDLP